VGDQTGHPATPAGAVRTTYGQWAERTRRLGGALADLGISPDGRVGTFAMNSATHLELYYAAPCTGRVLRTVNPRLFSDQVTYVVKGLEALLADIDTSRLRAVLCGGSAVPRALGEAYRKRFGVAILQAWGMTEISPVATVARVRSDRAGDGEEAAADLMATQGLPVPGVELRIAEPGTTDALAWDGTTSGEVQVAAPWAAAGYYDDERTAESFTPDGWLRTGDVASITPDGYVRLVDRTKDLIKSGGEWISSVELENELMAHPKVAEAAVVGVPDPRWQERPLACVVVRPGETITLEEVRAWLEPKVARWWLPDRLEIIDQVPRTSVGKFSKKELRERFAGDPSDRDISPGDAGHR